MSNVVSFESPKVMRDRLKKKLHAVRTEYIEHGFEYMYREYVHYRGLYQKAEAMVSQAELDAERYQRIKEALK